ncbi:hypothetical protein [Croceibacter atlanticus]|uniref:hypothetical protein n=1 Tax=Croceibacter atlanticus TaxID=313588 RepID=UPI0032B2BA57
MGQDPMDREKLWQGLARWQRGSGANLTGLPPTAGITTGIAGNTIASGDPVVVNSDGTLSSVEVAGNFGSLTQVATKHPKYLGLKYLTFHSKVIAQWVTDGEDYIYNIRNQRSIHCIFGL